MARISDLHEDWIHIFCIYCTRYERIKTVCDVKRGDSIRFPRCKRVYYHHATVKEVKTSSNPTSCYLKLIHLQKVGKLIKTKVIEDESFYDFNQTVIERVIHDSNPFSPDEIVQRAEKYILQNPNAKLYNLVGNNCEHTENQISKGVPVSLQVNSILNQMISGMSWFLFYILTSKNMRTPKSEVMSNLYALFDIVGKVITLNYHLKKKIVCSCCFYREFHSLRITLVIKVIGLGNSIIHHSKVATFSKKVIRVITGTAFLMCDLPVTKYFILLIKPAYLIPKHKIFAGHMPTAGDVLTFEYCSLPHLGVVEEVCGITTDANTAKVTIVHFSWRGQRYIVTEEDIYLKLTAAFFVLDYSGGNPYCQSDVVKRAKEQVGKISHNSLAYRSSSLARYCKTGDKKLKNRPKRIVKKIEDVSPGDIIEFKYCGVSHEAVVTNIGFAQNVEMKIIHYNYNGLFGSREVVEEKIKLSLSKNNYIHDFTSADTYDAEEVVRRARSRLGEKKFNCFTNRSSHLAYWCKIK